VATEESADLPRFAGVSVPEPEYAGDDGSPDPRLADVLSFYAAGSCSRRDVVVALLSARVMTPVMSVLDEAEESSGGLLQEKSSYMASVSMVGADGRRALLAFTSVAAMAAWDPAARGIPAPATRAAAAALDGGADALLIDLDGPVRLVLDGAALESLADGRVPPQPWDDPAVAAAVLTAAGQVPGLGRVRLAAPEDPADPQSPDLVLLVEPTREAFAASAATAATAETLAEQLARCVVINPVIAELCPRGVAVGMVDVSGA
jgi:hypothetical protein